MKISSIISEYNPLHNGHEFHINRTKEITNSDAIICIMSGNYVQRGLPAIIDKWNRSRVALLCGADLVLELPVLYSLSSAEFFSYGAISLLNSLGIVDSICFGSESGKIDELYFFAEILNAEPQIFKEALKQYLDLGTGYAAARSKALKDYFQKINKDLYIGFEESISSSNNILGIEYCKSLLKLCSNIKPYTIRREGASYNSDKMDQLFSSATAIRKYMKENINLSRLKEHMPPPSFDVVNQLSNSSYEFPDENKILSYIKYKNIYALNNLKKLPDVSEGLENKIIRAIEKSNNYSELISGIKSKRFTHSRISRIICQYFVGFENYNTYLLRKAPCPYARILGFNDTGKKLLKLAKSNSSIPVYTKLPKVKNEILELDLQATRTYSLLNSNISPNSDYLISPIFIQSSNK